VIGLALHRKTMSWMTSAFKLCTPTFPLPPKCRNSLPSGYGVKTTKGTPFLASGHPTTSSQSHPLQSHPLLCWVLSHSNNNVCLPLPSKSSSSIVLPVTTCIGFALKLGITLHVSVPSLYRTTLDHWTVRLNQPSSQTEIMVYQAMANHTYLMWWTKTQAFCAS